MKFGPLKPACRWVAISLAAASVFGCEDRASSDKDLISKVQAGVAKVATLPDLQAGDQLTAATGELTGALGEKNADPVYLAVAGGTVADLDQQAAYVGTLKLKMLETDVRRTLVQLRRLGMELASSTGYSEGLGKADPKDAVEKLTAVISGMQGNAQAATWGGDGTNLPTLAAAKQEKTKLDADIGDAQTQIADLQKQRTDALAKADQETAHADQLKGNEAVKVYGDAAESRKDGENFGIKIDLLQAKLARLKADAAVQDGQMTAVAAGVQSLESQGQALQTNWGATQKHAEAQKAIATAILEGDDQSKTSIKQVAGELKKQIDDLARARTTVLDQLKEAEKYAQDANRQASTYAQSVAAKRTTPGKEADAYKNLIASVSPSKYMYSAGVAERDLGTVSTAETGLLGEVQATVDAVKADVQAAGLTNPAELDGIDTSALKSLSDGADASLTAATDSLGNVESGDAPEALKSAAKVAKLITVYGHLQLYDLQAAAGNTDAKAKSTQLMSDAVALKGELESSNTRLPALPGPLGQPTPPATQPAS